jgi:starch synthase (maltosyl-transferring)
MGVRIEREMEGVEGRRRVVIERVTPEVDGGRYPIKRTIGEDVVVEADVFADGHDCLGVALLSRRDGDLKWREIPMTCLTNDRWQASFQAAELGRYVYTVTGWVDHFETWRQGFMKKVDAGQQVLAELRQGARLIDVASQRAPGAEHGCFNGEVF